MGERKRSVVSHPENCIMGERSKGQRMWKKVLRGPNISVKLKGMSYVEAKARELTNRGQRSEKVNLRSLGYISG